MPPAATVVQLFDWAYCAEAVMPLTVKLAVPVFDSVTVCGLLVVFRFWLGNVRLVEDKLAAGAEAGGVEVAGAPDPPQAAATSASAKAANAGALLHLR